MDKSSEILNKTEAFSKQKLFLLTVISAFFSSLMPIILIFNFKYIAELVENTIAYNFAIILLVVLCILSFSIALSLLYMRFSGKNKIKCLRIIKMFTVVKTVLFSLAGGIGVVLSLIGLYFGEGLTEAFNLPEGFFLERMGKGCTVFFVAALVVFTALTVLIFSYYIKTIMIVDSISDILRKKAEEPEFSGFVVILNILLSAVALAFSVILYITGINSGNSGDGLVMFTFVFVVMVVASLFPAMVSVCLVALKRSFNKIEISDGEEN